MTKRVGKVMGLRKTWYDADLNAFASALKLGRAPVVSLLIFIFIAMKLKLARAPIAAGNAAGERLSVMWLTRKYARGNINYQASLVRPSRARSAAAGARGMRSVDRYRAAHQTAPRAST
jgi:hypothetical protein